MKTLLLALLLILGGCAHGARKVDCDTHVTAINPPTPAVKVASP
jgi:hypothetical protein